MPVPRRHSGMARARRWGFR